ncbi:hypothetical protein MSG28_000018 [Choristoneura fumiferana]|uniref:Uncharacterized protein n=1 Tax=Choristoneura fumiferana TaxID=7141 RepID=A0ACC0JZ41_CHOFU|nr:hypothetical protein MSG28_000018 [Choristoneura fumiferana]
MRAVRALSKKNAPKVKSSDSDQEMDVDPESDKEDDDKECEGDGASDEDLLKVIRYLVAAGCDVNIPGPEGMTALHTAARYGHVAACEALLGGARAQVDPRDHGGWTPLVWAAEHQRPLAVRLLLEHGADATATDIEGNAAAHWCALAGDAQSLRLLVEASPRAVAAVNAHRDTPLHVAARQGHYACVVILLAHGARTDVENSAGELPVEVCSGECQSAISLNMQMAIAARDVGSGYRMLCSDLSNGREEFPVPCVNEVDDAPAPDDFTYVTRHVTPRPVAVDDTIDTLQVVLQPAARRTTRRCAPNVAPVRVFAGGRDLRLPAVCLFAARDIAPGEELTLRRFDYDKHGSWFQASCQIEEVRVLTEHIRSVGAKCDGEVPNDLEQRENMLPTPDAKGKPETAANPAGKQEKLDAKQKLAKTTRSLG